LVPVTVTVGAVPTGALAGLTELIVGITLGVKIVSGTALEVPPPGAGFVTVICAVPGFAMADCGTLADSTTEP
jgi:hypothetical protein